MKLADLKPRVIRQLHDDYDELWPEPPRIPRPPTFLWKKKSYWNNPERIAAWKKANPERVREHVRRCRERKRERERAKVLA